ncbi:hypothetical protein F183_A28400 [Bryobacterales bacterium F-183]|nr:hypothetical protein F183_A28400 [Bryobacterales bacterium F-183]
MSDASSIEALPTLRRRDWLIRAGGGCGVLALHSLLCGQNSANPLAVRQPHFAAKAKSIIWLFMNGGPSHIDTWDYKPALTKANGKTFEGFDTTTGFFDTAVGPLLQSPFAFQQHGQSGAWVSSLFPYLSQHVDKMAFVKSFRTKSNNHSPALFMANTGDTRMGRPCAGSWLTYGLGTENQNLPGFVVMTDAQGRGMPKGHATNWSNGFLPGAYQGNWVRSQSGTPIANLKRPANLTPEAQRRRLDLLAELNNAHLAEHPGQPELEARIASFELAYRMQSEALDCFDIAKEPEKIRQIYGLDDERCSHFGRQCLLARRMVERGVRFIQIYSGGTANDQSWDGHADIRKNHTEFAGETDRPIAGLLADLEQRGLLEQCLVIWGGEFGRLPVSQLSNGLPTGRDHNPHAGCFWFAGGGVQGGTSIGETDELGHKAVVDPVDIHDIHATILHLAGLDHRRLTYLHNGRNFRLTDVAGKVLKTLLA